MTYVSKAMRARCVTKEHQRAVAASIAPKKYFTLVVDEDKSGRYSPEFGDYDRKVVEQEKVDSFFGKRTKIIVTGDKQADIQAGVRKLNEEEARKRGETT